MKIDKEFCQKFRREAMPEINEILKKYGIRASVGNITFLEDSFRTKLEVEVIRGPGERVSIGVAQHSGFPLATPKGDDIAADFTKYAPELGFKVSDLFREIRMGGQRLRIVGYKLEGGRRVIVLEGRRGGRYIADYFRVVSALKAA